MYDPENRNGEPFSGINGTPDYIGQETTADSAPAANASDSAGTGEAPVNSVTDSGGRDARDSKQAVDGEYHFTAPETTRNAYSDAGYVPTESAAAVPPRYRYAAPTPPPKEKKRKARRGLGAGAIVALCLVCAILGGLGGGALACILLPQETDSSVSAPAETNGTVINKADTSTNPNTSTVSTNIVPSGDILDPTEIYTLACSQAVAITTEITYTNFLGYTSSAAVSGSGFIISSNGYILTNHHVIEDAVEGGYDVTVLTYDGTEYLASIVGYEEDNDVAVLKIDAEGLNPVVLGDSDSITVGEPVYAVGNPLGELQFTMTDGLVSALDRAISSTDQSTGVTTTINMFQISAAINSGNSGGPVYNCRGEVIGIATAKYADTGVEGLGFAIPINDAMDIANQLITNGYVSGKAYMGIVAQTVNSTAIRYYNMVEGAYVYSITPGSCAEECGLKVGDIIVAMDDTAISSHYDLISAKKSYHAGDSAVLKVYRSGEYLELTIVFDEEVPETESSQTAQTDTAETNPAPNNGGAYPFGNR